MTDEELLKSYEEIILGIKSSKNMVELSDNVELFKEKVNLIKTSNHIYAEATMHRIKDAYKATKRRLI